MLGRRLLPLVALLFLSIEVNSSSNDSDKGVDVVVSDCKDFTPQMLRHIAKAPKLFPPHSRRHRAFIYHKCGESAEWALNLADPESAAEELSSQVRVKSWRVHHATLPNYGFEAHTYMHHIATNYDDLAELTLFLQGNPFIHAPNLLHAQISYSLPMTWLVTDENWADPHWTELKAGLETVLGLGSLAGSWDNKAYAGGSATLEGLQPADLRAHGKAGVASIAAWLHARQKGQPNACSVVGDVADFLREFWPGFSLTQKRCFHAPQGAQFAVRASAIRAHPRALFTKAVDALTPGIGLDTYVTRQNRRGGMCNNLVSECDGEAEGNGEDEEKERGKQLALQLPTRTAAGQWRRQRRLNTTHCEASYVTAILLEYGWQLLFSDSADGCIADWRAALPLRAHCIDAGGTAFGHVEAPRPEVDDDVEEHEEEDEGHDEGGGRTRPRRRLQKYHICQNASAYKACSADDSSPGCAEPAPCTQSSPCAFTGDVIVRRK